MIRENVISREPFQKIEKVSVWIIIYSLIDKSINLSKRSKDINNPNLFNFYGGSVEKNESSIEAAIRELEEEAGLTVEKNNLIKLCELSTDNRNCIYYGYPIVKKPSIKLNFESSKHIWIPIKNLNKLKLHPPTALIAPILEEKLNKKFPM